MFRRNEVETEATPVYTLGELLRLRDVLNEQLPETWETKQQIHQTSAVITFKWHDKRPVMPAEGVANGTTLTTLISEAPGTLYQIVVQLIATMQALTEAGQ